MSEAKWYVVHTYSGYENKVKANIEKTIENRHLEDQILEVRVPLEDVVEMRNGVSKQVQRKMFPSYVLINMVMNDDTWYVVRNTRGVTGFVGPGSKPVPLTEEEMKPLGIKDETVRVDFARGRYRSCNRRSLERDYRCCDCHQSAEAACNDQCRDVWTRNTGCNQFRRSSENVTDKGNTISWEGHTPANTT